MAQTLITTENIVNIIETSPPKGDQGEPGLPGDAVLPSNITINRDLNDQISSIDFASGKTVTINRDINGEIQSIDDGTYTRSIVRINGEIDSIIIT